MSHGTPSSADRAKASKLRQKPSLSPAETQWLEDYAARHPNRRGSRPAPSPARPPPPFQATEIPEDIEPELAADEVALPPSFFRASPPTDALFAPSSDEPDVDAEEPCAAGPDCPACAQERALVRCSRTGKRIYPPMSDTGAKGLGGAVLGILALFVLLARKGDFQPANEHEIAAMADALKEVQRRRLNSMGAVDDVLAVLFVSSAFLWRTART